MDGWMDSVVFLGFGCLALASRLLSSRIVSVQQNSTIQHGFQYNPFPSFLCQGLAVGSTPNIPNSVTWIEGYRLSPAATVNFLPFHTRGPRIDNRINLNKSLICIPRE
ncbi:hypothetical protein ASPTUDRAFT_253455 [Aspergillus tubingensis CBS 134.48]|uniref:Uncharacterized protein n=1 Tax=Aspergillus tubingensis (strain CBS 134.48) TaxID=767770 RepID=A0A1L9NMZ5_ASPTC|nr:hypothetical protein ASPTUDRAFT_253455 [Aspergillus tubingensis CBS 134.48]